MNDDKFVIVDGHRVHISWLESFLIDDFDTEFEELGEEEWMWMDDPLLDDLDEELDPKFSKFATIKKDKKWKQNLKISD